MKIKQLTRYFQNRAKDPRQQFQQIMAFANETADFGPEVLRDLIKVLLRPLQASLIVGVFERPPHSAPGEIKPWNFFMGEKHASLFMENEAKPLCVDGFKVRLASDIILPCPWDRERTKSALVNTGTGKSFGPWKEDSNHVVILWMPWRSVRGAAAPHLLVFPWLI
ncbi:MAG: hypothetical protein QOI53_3646, partial [Verrucomicrobiota bacterium]|nr:hypothetical protein [Verrucomicrobiota bacterium]